MNAQTATTITTPDEAKRDEMIARAQAESNASGIEITVYRCPISLGEQEGFDTPWGYAPTSSLPIIARFREAEKDIQIRPLHGISVGDQVTVCGHSDRVSYTVIKVRPTKLTLQQNSRTLLNGFDSQEADKLTFTPGGFAGHTEGVQRYSVTPNPEGAVVLAYLRRTQRKVWTDGAYAHVIRRDFWVGSSRVIEGQHDFYDYNF